MPNMFERLSAMQGQTKKDAKNNSSKMEKSGFNNNRHFAKTFQTMPD